MNTIKGLTVYFDVDQTLVVFGPGDRPGEYKVAPHLRHVRALKEHAHRGHKVIVWSAGGAEWAEQVVKELGLSKYVDLCISKPSWYYDDKTVEHYMPECNRVYFEDDDAPF